MNRQEEVLFSIMRGFFENPNFENLFRLFQGEDRILYYLSTQNRADITPSELSERLHITRARATAAVQELERKQYVTRIRSQKDKRRIYLSLTEDGTSVYSPSCGVGAESIARAFGGAWRIRCR